MQFLTNAIPGFRDLRGPIIAGYLWLLFGWLLTAPDVHHRPSGHTAAIIYDLGHEVGHLGILTAASVTAYLLGSISQELSITLRRVWKWLIEPTISLRFLVTQSSPLRGTSAIGSMLVSNYRRGIEMIETVEDPRAASLRVEQLETQMEQAKHELERELRLTATLLVGERPELFARVDQLRGEAELRLAVVPPLMSIAILLASNASRLWLMALLPIVLLYIQGLRKDADAQAVISDAMSLNKIRSTSVESFSKWIDQLSGEIRQGPTAPPITTSPLAR